MRWSLAICTTVLVTLLVAPAVDAAPTEVIDLASIKPRCDAPFKINADASGCEADAAAFAGIKTQRDCLKVTGATWAGTACGAPTDPGKFPKPDCGSQLADLVYNPDKKSCQVVRHVPRGSLGDFVGDCFKVHSPPPDGVEDSLAANSYFTVESQAKLANDDKELVVAPAQPVGFAGLTFWCSTTGAAERRVKASTLVNIGAHRYGWAYGVLSLPFKYHSHDKSFTPGTFNIGPYLGRRWGSSGSAITAAVAAAIGSVRGEVRDAQGNITSTPDLTAFTLAAGLMLDVSKNPDLKPFKVGLFYGMDRVNASDAIKYAHNRKPWVAFQIGYDFTDN